MPLNLFQDFTGSGSTQSQEPSTKPPIREPIAVVGIGCRLPGGVSTVKAFWETLLDGIDTVSEIPADRFDFASFHDNGDPRKYGAIRNCKGGFVQDIAAFDAEFFGYYPAEASRIDPQQRLVLEASVHALEDSGTTLEQVAGSRTGVFLGNFLSDYMTLVTTTKQRDHISPHLAMGVANCSIANRVSHRLDLQGPSLTVDTACSSSLVSLHLACQSIWAHESDGALAGGVNAILRPESSILMSKGGFLSPDGACKSFDAAANGYVRSEGVGMVFLKPLSRALRDKDRIYALIRGSLVNQDGYTPDGFTVPSLKAQSALLKSLYSRSGVDPAKVRYVEAHGPGTVVGDPIEANALGQQLGQIRSKDSESLWIGSLKGNFGHLEGAAGIAGFIKAALVTYHGVIPPQTNHISPNPSIDFESLRLKVPLNATKISRDRPIWVGVNSFGAGGTNAHAILEQAPRSTTRSQPSHGARAFTISARSLQAMEHAARDLSSHLRHEDLNLDDVAYTLNMRRSHHSQTSIISATSMDDLCSQLDIIAAGGVSKDILTLQKRINKPSKVAFVFSGQGGQWLGMGAALAAQEQTFRKYLAAFDAVFARLAGFSILSEMNADGSVSRLNKTAIVQPAIAAIQIALARTLMSYGMKPDAIVGHSIGEVAAAHIAGALNLEEAVEVIYLRSTIQSKASGTGSMLAAGISSAEASRIISRRKFAAKIEIATLNGPKMTTLSGDTECLETLAGELHDRGVFSRFVKVEVPYHSHFMDPLKTELLESFSVSGVRSKCTDIALYSTVTTFIEPGTHLNGHYWFENVRKPVRYVETATRMLQDGCNVFIEIGPHPVLVSGTREVAALEKVPAYILPAMIRENDLVPISHIIGAMHTLGVEVDIEAFNGGSGSFVNLPLYPFQRENYWFEHPEAQNRRLEHSRHPFLEDSTSLTDYGRGTLRLRLSTGAFPFLSDHEVDGSLIFPMTGHLEAAYLAAREYMPHDAEIWLEDLRFDHPVVLAAAEEFPPQVQLEITSPEKDFAIASRQAASSSASAWQICSRGRINMVDLPPSVNVEDLGSVRARIQTGSEVNVEIFYQKLEESGLRYGEAFRAVQNIWRFGNELFSYVKLPPSCQQEAARFRFHPALLDACNHTLFADVHHHGDSRIAYLPSQTDKVLICNANGAASAFAHIKIISRSNAVIRCNVSIYGENGQVLAVIAGLSLKSLESQAASLPREHRLCFQSEDSQAGLRRVDVNFSNIFVLDSGLSAFDWLSPLQRAFPDARITRQNLDAADTQWNAVDRGFELDRRTLLLVPAVFSPIDSGDVDLHQTTELIFKALIRIAGWIHEQQATCSFVVITRGGSMTPVDMQCDPLSSSLEAAVRVMVNEFPRARLRVIDVGLTGKCANTTLLEEEFKTIRPGRDDTVVAVRPEGRFFKALEAVDVAAEQRTKTILPARGGSYRCERARGSDSEDSIVIRQHALAKLGPNDVMIEVHAAGLNYKDVMNDLGLLTEKATSGGLAQQELGLEVAGKVLKKGEDVQEFDIGARVMAQLPNGLAGLAVVDYRLIAPVPSPLTMAEAACIPTVYVTAYYALLYLGRLTQGESVLIHSAAGGVGIAAIRIAQIFGARIFATAGSPERREVVSQMGVEAVFDSRSLNFHDEVKKATNGKGVDLVLNSLTGPMLTQSIACLAPFGRFLEIGKVDIYQNMRLGLEKFGQNCSFFAIDIDRLAGQKPTLYRRMLQAVCQLFENGQLQGPTVTKFPISKLSTAISSLSRSAVIGKVAIEMPENATVDAAPPTRLRLQSDRSYLVTGGTNGLGLHLARFLVDRGAMHVVLVSRSGPKTPEDQAIIADMQECGAKVHVKSADVSSAASVVSLFGQETDWPPIVGVIHCAAVVHDSFSHDITPDAFLKVFGPKAIGAWNLHLATKDKDLDFFTMTSSVSSITAAAGTFSYSAANQFLDSLAHHRRASGLAGLSLNLGLLGDFAGIVAKSANPTELVENLEMQGLSLLRLPTILSLLERAVLQDVTQRLALGIDVSRFLQAYPHLSSNGLFSMLAGEETKGGASESQGLMSRLPRPERLEIITETLRRGLASTVGLEPSRISVAEKMDQYASDSLTLTQMRGVIIRAFQVTLPLMRLFQGPTLQEVAEDVDSSLYKNTSDAQGIAKVSMDNFTDDVLLDGLSILSPWLIRGTGHGRRVICFHAMGGAASQFNSFLLQPPEGIDPIAVQLPGREGRADEPIPANIQNIVAEVLTELEQSVGQADVFWGHSLGGIVAFEAMRELRRQGKPLPRLLITSTIAPQLVKWLQQRELFLQISSEEASPEYVMAVSQYVEGADFARSMLPMMRKDSSLMLGYQYTEEAIFDVPITAIAARKDDVVYRDEVAAWGAHSSSFNMIDMDGDHWSVVQKNPELMWKAISDLMAIG